MLHGVPIHAVGTDALAQLKLQENTPASTGVVRGLLTVKAPWGRPKQHALVPLEDPDEDDKKQEGGKARTRRAGARGRAAVCDTSERHQLVVDVAGVKDSSDSASAACAASTAAASAAAAAAATAAAAAAAAAAANTAAAIAANGGTPTKPRVVLQLLSGAFQELDVDSSCMRSMAELQDAVAAACEKALPTVEQQRCGELVMQVRPGLCTRPRPAHPHARLISHTPAFLSHKMLRDRRLWTAKVWLEP